MNKRDFMLEKQIARYFVQYSEFLSTLLSFYATQMIYPFPNSMISTIKKCRNFMQCWNHFTTNCFSSVESILYEY